MRRYLDFLGNVGLFVLQAARRALGSSCVSAWPSVLFWRFTRNPG
jgi:hypothetical protein